MPLSSFCEWTSKTTTLLAVFWARDWLPSLAWPTCCLIFLVGVLDPGPLHTCGAWPTRRTKGCGALVSCPGPLQPGQAARRRTASSRTFPRASLLRGLPASWLHPLLCGNPGSPPDGSENRWARANQITGQGWDASAVPLKALFIYCISCNSITPYQKMKTQIDASHIQKWCQTRSLSYWANFPLAQSISSSHPPHGLHAC